MTFASECELKRQRCLCKQESPLCADVSYTHAHIDYFGACVEVKTCSDFEMEEFPLRMRKMNFDP